MAIRTGPIMAVCMALVLFVSWTTASRNQTASSSSPGLAASNIELLIDYGNSTQHVFAGLSGATVFEVLNETTYVTYVAYTFGRFIQSINGVGNNAGGNGYYWQYWVNEQLGPVAADYYVLSDGDNVLWRYCAPALTSPGIPPGTPDWRISLFIIVGVGCALVAVTVLMTRKSR